MKPENMTDAEWAVTPAGTIESLRQQLDAAALDYDVCNRMRQQADNANAHNGDIIMQLMKDKDALTARLAEAESENENLRIQCAAFDYTLTEAEASYESMRTKLAAAEHAIESQAVLLNEFAEHAQKARRERGKQ